MKVGIKINKNICIHIYHIMLLLITILLFLAITSIQVYADVIVVGYYPNWLKQKLPAEKIKFQNLTHINHVFVWPEADGSISMYEDFIYPQLIEKVHNAGKKIMVTLGGWGQSDGFSTMAANSAARANFIENITNFCLNYGYDGVDIDWEHPANATDRNNMTILVYELRQALMREIQHY